ncbi:YraN family protein [Paenibacillus tepidiphilus]|uniref:YraN family protein n=1 Tax=Paenibacillus tepidiphilus TaxID=2608683 RepID=UPI001238FFB6|nr:YraN family protein [Paenibacillus tepidiphilus]
MEPGRERYSRKQKGTAAEDAAALYLASRGYAILERNWRCRSGELDIVAELAGRLVIVEVRSRGSNPLPGTPEESVDARKIRRVRQAAAIYLHQQRHADRQVTFDVVTVLLHEDLSIAALHHIREAF